MIKNVVFDVGNVMVHFRYREYMADLGFDKDTVDFFEKNIIRGSYWKLMDNGLVDDGKAEEYFIEQYPQYEKEMRLFWAHIEDIMEEFDYSEGLVKELKAKGLGVYALSNYPDKLSDLHWPTFKFLKEMDGYVISAKVKLLKPGEEIYRCLADKYGIKLEESVFVDDTAVNVEAAEALGMKGIVFKGIDDLKNELKSCIL